MEQGGEMSGGGSELCEANRRRLSKEKDKKLVRRREQKGETSGGGSELCQVKRRRLNKKKDKKRLRRRKQRGEMSGGGSKLNQKKRRLSKEERRVRRFLKDLEYLNDVYSKAALKYYEKIQGVKYEIVQGIFEYPSPLVVPGFKGITEWCHVSFTAKPKNADVAPKLFFAELFEDTGGKYTVTCCSVLEPNDPGIASASGCILCTPDTKFHPSHGYLAGHPPCYIPELKYV